METIGRPILAALEFAQLQKIVHRDIKPKNILVGDGVTPKIADYGILKFVSANNACAGQYFQLR